MREGKRGREKEREREREREIEREISSGEGKIKARYFIGVLGLLKSSHGRSYFILNIFGVRDRS